jgi:hypothetical protein
MRNTYVHCHYECRHESSLVVLQSGCGGVSLDAELARSTYPEAEKLQSHKATKREKRDRTSDLGSYSAASRLITV